MKTMSKYGLTLLTKKESHSTKEHLKQVELEN